ncbi:MAG TPA: hypothetical protein GX512_03735 [Firmicutes bacterium]|nr:hypothetical protein [Candidatus Fermentithermobacillaceae bacterium]
MIWRAEPKQAVFLSCEDDEVLYGGAAGGGKSDALLIFSIMRRVAIPSSRGLILRRTFPELERTLILRSHQLLTGRAKWQAQQKRWRFPNGSILEFGYCASEEDVYQYQGAEYEDICFDELTQFTEFQYTYLQSRLRTTKPGVKVLTRAATNPGGPGHLWVKSRFVDVGPPNTPYRDPESGLVRRYIPATIDDNSYIDRAAYERNLSALPEAERRALRYGDWDVFSGQYFREFRRDIHVIRPFDIPSWWRRFRSLDYGLDCTACYWWAVDQSGRCFVYRELYESGLNLSKAAQKIVDMTPAEERISYTVASPDLWNRRQETGQSGEEIMRQAGLTGLVKADHNRIPGWRALREYLEPYTDEQGVEVARLAIFENCVNLIRTLPALVHDTHNPEDVDDACEDHAPESIRYGVMSRPGRSVPEEEQKKRLRARQKLVRPASRITGY